MHLSEELSSCEQKLKEAQTAKESLEKCQKELAALEQKEKVLQDKLLRPGTFIHQQQEAFLFL